MQQRNLNEAFEEEGEEEKAGKADSRNRSSTSPLSNSRNANRSSLSTNLQVNDDTEEQEGLSEEQMMFSKMHEGLADGLLRKHIMRRHFESWKVHVKSWKNAIKGIDKEAEIDSFINL